MSSIPNRRQIPIRPDMNRGELQNLLLGEIAKTGTYKNSVVADLRPKLQKIRQTSHDSVSNIDMAIEDGLDRDEDVATLVAYVTALDQFVGKTLGLTYQGAPAPWAREAIHYHITHPNWPRPSVAVGYFPFWRDFTVDVRVTDLYARAEVFSHEGERVDEMEVNAPTWTAFDDWACFTEQSVAMFKRHLERIRAEMLDDFARSGANKRLAGLAHQQKTIERLARICMASRRNWSTELHRDGDVENERSEKQHIRSVCALIMIDSPFSRGQKK